MLLKFLTLAAVIAIAWYGFKLVGRIGQQHKQKLTRDEKAARDGVADTVQCPVCDAYIAEDIKSNCGKADCPY
ncbi:MAG: hypothetical protein GKS00_27355 [Alphaproteobacteria bacterium]|nr:hypothetical protein [Alphaproteobacteria bacterium]